jgi:8-oxo-dGTP diphosphatase
MAGSLMPRNRSWRNSSVFDPAVRMALRLIFPLLTRWWRLWGREHEGAQVAIWVDGSLLLTRSSYRTDWNLPGGGIERGEHPEAAARRELAEEIGVTGIELIAKGSASGLWDGRRDRVWFFEARPDRLPELRLDNREIIEARLVSRNELGELAITGPVAAYLRDIFAP